MKAARAFVATLLALGAIGVAGWFGWSAFGPESTEGGARELTYRNVSIILPPEDSGLRARADYAPPESIEKPGGGPVIVVTDESEARSGYMVIDANTGEVLLDTIGGGLRDEADAVIASKRLDAEPPVGVWPLADVAPPEQRREFGSISYIEPDKSSGIFVSFMVGDPSGRKSLFIHNGASRMTFNESGKVNMSLVLPEDKEAFERLAGTIRVDGAP